MLQPLLTLLAAKLYMQVDIHIDIEAELGIELPPSSDDEELEDESGDEMNEVEGDMHAPASDLESTERAQNKNNNSTTNGQQLSKKQREELKKKELEQLDEVLAELGIAPESKESADDKLIASSKAAKRKARKARQQETNMGSHHLEIKSEGSGQSTEPEQPAIGLTTSTNGTESAQSGPAVDFEAVKAAKLAIARKKSSGNKKAGAAAAAAAAAAEARKTKKVNNKDKSKYNEMPTR